MVLLPYRLDSGQKLEIELLVQHGQLASIMPNMEQWIARDANDVEVKNGTTTMRAELIGVAILFFRCYRRLP